jgi:hypothetical protein
MSDYKKRRACASPACVPVGRVRQRPTAPRPVLRLVARCLIGPEYLVGDHQTGEQYKARNDAADDDSGVLECLGTVRVDIKHGHLL